MWTPARTAEKTEPGSRGPLGLDHLTEGQWRRPLFSAEEGRMTAGQLWTLIGFFIMMVHPTSRNWLIFPLYMISAAVGLFRWVRRRDQSIAPISLAFVCGTGVLLTIMAVLRNTPGGGRVALPIVFGPCIYYAIALGLDRRTAAKLPGVISVALAVVSLSTIIVGLFEAYSWMFWLSPNSGSTEIGGAYNVRLGALGSLAGLVPFMAFYIASWKGEKTRIYSAHVVVFGLAVVAVFISGRTALMFVLILSVAVSAFMRGFLWRERKPFDEQGVGVRRKVIPGGYLMGAFAVLGLTALFAFSNISFSGTVERTLAKFGQRDETVQSKSFVQSNEASAQLRLKQADILLDGFYNSPLLGDDTGRTLDSGIVRDERRPWNYELQYHVLLFRNGLFGAGLYLAAVAIGIGEIWKRWPKVDPRTRHVTIGACGAAMGMLFANATNPYLQAVGQQWALFIPVMVICARKTLLPGERRSDGPEILSAYAGGDAPTTSTTG